ncbi:hypothetical protein Pla108_25310 [Botrimarina colliarenosi]|uniref:HEAT repeat protein n=1 Tax=Botrimarina colliarenosi TaxID=2528001 RepID=A0A5C6ABL0_9BACT|nr:HEAT repeat domain-containing protein [Botrimarina colliarenosi]TWT96757.1 hypothetical protein Pla108_25310 [Botrimarina colliarenosi]
MLRPTAAALCLAVFTAAQPAPADQVELSTGGRLDAEVVPDAASNRSQLAIQSPYGRIVLDRDRVARSVSESPAEAEYRRRAPSVSDTVEAQFALANWCRDNGVADGLRRHLQRVLELDPDHAEARMLLGYQQVDGRWMTRDDVLAARGLVRWGGEYRTPQEVALLERIERQESEALAWRKQLADWRSGLESADRDTARAAEDAFDQLEDPMAMPELLKLLADEPVPAVRRRLVRAIGRIATPEGLAALASIVITARDPELRAEAVDQLAADGRPGLALPFVAALRADDPVVINNAGWALARLGSTATIEPLIDALVTVHRRQVGNVSGGDDYSMTFSPTQGSFGFGGGGPKIEQRTSRNTQVLETLVHLTGVNFLYDQDKWRAWLASRQVAERVNLRRDP